MLLFPSSFEVRSFEGKAASLESRIRPLLDPDRAAPVRSGGPGGRLTLELWRSIDGVWDGPRRGQVALPPRAARVAVIGLLGSRASSSCRIGASALRCSRRARALATPDPIVRLVVGPAATASHCARSRVGRRLVRCDQVRAARGARRLARRRCTPRLSRALRIAVLARGTTHLERHQDGLPR